MCKILNASVNRKQDSLLPHHTDEKKLVNEFDSFFLEKIKINRIRSQLSSDSSNFPNENESNIGEKLEKFEALSEAEIKVLILLFF